MDGRVTSSDTNKSAVVSEKTRETKSLVSGSDALSGGRSEEQIKKENKEAVQQRGCADSLTTLATAALTSELFSELQTKNTPGSVPVPRDGERSKYFQHSETRLESSRPTPRAVALTQDYVKPPGLPSAPSSIRISKSSEGAHISWAPVICEGRPVTAYSICLAVQNSTPSTMVFSRIYLGTKTQAVIPNSVLQDAEIITSNKPAIIFRIAARNSLGFGPATQVRWLQDVPVKPAEKRSIYSPPVTPPTKRFKTNSYLGRL